MTLDGAMGGAAFLAYVEQGLIPTLLPGDIIVMDNLPAHKAPAAHIAIEAARARLMLLPPYSPATTSATSPEPARRWATADSSSTRSAEIFRHMERKG
ncbi:transposase (plasmid) [Tistrella bauzanensis]